MQNDWHREAVQKMITMNRDALPHSSSVSMPLIYVRSQASASISHKWEFSSVQFSRSVMCDTLRPHGLQHARCPVHHQHRELNQTHVHQVAYWTPTDLESSSFSVLFFAFSYCSWGSQGKNTEVVCHSLLQWTTFCQNSPWPICLGWPYTAWLILSLS